MSHRSVKFAWQIIHSIDIREYKNDKFFHQSKNKKDGEREKIKISTASNPSIYFIGISIAYPICAVPISTIEYIA